MELSARQAAAIGRAQVLHGTGITLAISQTSLASFKVAVQVAKENGLLVSFDINHRPKLWSRKTACIEIEALLPFVDILFPSMDEVIDLWDIHDIDTAFEFFQSFGVQKIIFKDGESSGAALWVGQRYAMLIFKVNSIDSTGVGDAFAGGFLRSILTDLNPETALRRASATAALAVSGLGAIGGLPTEGQLERFMIQSTACSA